MDYQAIELEKRIKRDQSRIMACFVLRQIKEVVQGGRHSGAELKRLIELELPRITETLKNAEV